MHVKDFEVSKACLWPEGQGFESQKRDSTTTSKESVCLLKQTDKQQQQQQENRFAQNSIVTALVKLK